jgi:hypothetical protein
MTLAISSACRRTKARACERREEGQCRYCIVALWRDCGQKQQARYVVSTQDSTPACCQQHACRVSSTGELSADAREARNRLNLMCTLKAEYACFCCLCVPSSTAADTARKRACAFDPRCGPHHHAPGRSRALRDCHAPCVTVTRLVLLPVALQHPRAMSLLCQGTRARDGPRENCCLTAVAGYRLARM